VVRKREKIGRKVREKTETVAVPVPARQFQTIGKRELVVLFFPLFAP